MQTQSEFRNNIHSPRKWFKRDNYRGPCSDAASCRAPKLFQKLHSLIKSTSSWKLGLLCIYKSEDKWGSHFLEWLWKPVLTCGISHYMWSEQPNVWWAYCAPPLVFFLQTFSQMHLETTPPRSHQAALRPSTNLTSENCAPLKPPRGNIQTWRMASNVTKHPKVWQ